VPQLAVVVFLFHERNNRMGQSALNRYVAQATGESVRRIQRMGFVLLVHPANARPRRRVPHGGHAGRFSASVETSKPAGMPRR